MIAYVDMMFYPIKYFHTEYNIAITIQIMVLIILKVILCMPGFGICMED